MPNKHRMLKTYSPTHDYDTNAKICGSPAAIAFARRNGVRCVEA